MSQLHPERSSRAFDWQCRKLEGASALSAWIVSLGYLVLLFELESSEQVALAACLIGSSIVAGLIAEPVRRRQVGPVTRYLDQNTSTAVDRNSNTDGSSAFDAIVSLPSRMQRTKFLAGLAPILLVPALMGSMGFEAWLSGERLLSLAMISLVVSLMSGTLLFYWAKRRFTALRIALASVAGDSAARSARITRRSLQRRLLFAGAVPAFASVLLVVDVVSVSMRFEAENEAAKWAMIAVESVAQANTGFPLAARIVNQLQLETIEISSARFGASMTPGESSPFLAALDLELDLGETTGLIVPDFGPEIGAYRRLEDGGVLVSKLLRSDLGPPLAGAAWAIGLVCLGVLGIALIIGRLASAEVGAGLETLRAAAERMAAGDLSEGIAYESEDELGDLGRTLASVGDMLRSSLARLSSTAESAERTAQGVSDVLADIVATNAMQLQQLKNANQVIATIATRVSEASQFAESLHTTIDESGNSLLELGATGDELNETASVLIVKVSEVSESLEQMVGSIEQVAGSSQRLAEASEETSASMEEMASTMRAVDTSAETTAKLSLEVVNKAELGRARVVQTIEGMEAIREATDVAEQVIRGLGTRTNEIGGILDVIDDVADETNLLALNAAIIAAQAGEHGRSFSVVADEIKELAERVLASTKEIGGLIRAVQDESENAIGAIEAGSASVMSGVDLSAEAGRTLEEITVASRESGLRIHEIVASVQEQTKAASHVVSLMERVRETAEEIGAAGKQQDQGNELAYQSALSMREIADQVRRTTAEQAAGLGRIRENVEGVREAAEQITGSLGKQAGACRRVTESLGLVSKGTRSNEEAAGKMREAIREFSLQAETLRQDAERFTSDRGVRVD